MDNSRLQVRRIISYEGTTRNFSMSISFGGFVLYTAAHFGSYLEAEDYYNRMMANMEAIFKNLVDATKLSFKDAGDVTHGTVDPRTLVVNYDAILGDANDPQSDEMPEADDATGVPDNWELAQLAVQAELEDEELQLLRSELANDGAGLQLTPEEIEAYDDIQEHSMYEPLEHEPYDPIRYE